MVDLIAKTPLADLLPKSIGGLSMVEAEFASLSAIMPFKGQDAQLRAAMQADHGLDVPAAGASRGDNTARLIWFGRDQYLLAGPQPGPTIAATSALSDQSDAWACLELSGTGAVDVLARLAPLDLRETAFPTGATARSLIGHMHGSITRLDDTRFLLMVFRSMAETLVHDLSEAMDTVVARQ